MDPQKIVIRDMMIDFQFIDIWEPKYDELETDQKEYLFLINKVKEDIKNYHSISIDTFKRIINWKSVRTKGYIKWDNYTIYQKAFQIILNQPSENKIGILDDLPGIGPPVASTILHFIFPTIFPIYDFRTLEVLNYFSYLTNKTTSSKNYPKFHSTITGIKERLVNYDLRQIDRALFSFHKLNPKIFKASCKHCPNNPHNETNINKGLLSNKIEESIPERIKCICIDLGQNGRVITRKEIIEKGKELGIKQSSILPADYCDNTSTAKWSKHNFLHAISPGKYVLKLQ